MALSNHRGEHPRKGIARAGCVDDIDTGGAIEYTRRRSTTVAPFAPMVITTGAPVTSCNQLAAGVPESPESWAASEAFGNRSGVACKNLRDQGSGGRGIDEHGGADLLRAGRRGRYSLVTDLERDQAHIARAHAGQRRQSPVRRSTDHSLPPRRRSDFRRHRRPSPTQLQSAHDGSTIRWLTSMPSARSAVIVRSPAASRPTEPTNTTSAPARSCRHGLVGTLAAWQHHKLVSKHRLARPAGGSRRSPRGLRLPTRRRTTVRRCVAAPCAHPPRSARRLAQCLSRPPQIRANSRVAYSQSSVDGSISRGWVRPVARQRPPTPCRTPP